MKAKELVVVEKSSDGKKGASRSVKSVPVHTPRTRAVRMPQRSNKNA